MNSAPPEVEAPAVAVGDLSVRFGEHWALEDVTFSAPEGRLWLFSGRTGAEKPRC
jgi:ABC-type multidrug transport system ATPase subunit